MRDFERPQTTRVSLLLRSCRCQSALLLLLCCVALSLGSAAKGTLSRTHQATRCMQQSGCQLQAQQGAPQTNDLQDAFT